MRNSDGFDLWSKDYDKTVTETDESDKYPFAGYKKVLDSIFRVITTKRRARVLDIGFGTGAIATKLYNQGYDIWGQDFSLEMLKSAQDKMPNAHLYLGDFGNGLCKEITEQKYDYIVMTYSLHHLADEKSLCLSISY